MANKLVPPRQGGGKGETRHCSQRHPGDHVKVGEKKNKEENFQVKMSGKKNKRGNRAKKWVGERVAPWGGPMT